MYTTLTVFLLIFAFCKQACGGAPVRSKVGHRRIPGFMQHLYQRYLADTAPFSSIVHSNAAIVKISKVSFEATFSDLGFLQRENIKRAKLRLNIPLQNNCSRSALNIHVMEHKSGKVIGNYVMSPQTSGVNTLILTKSVRKLIVSRNQSKKLKVRITLRNPNAQTSTCSNFFNNFSSETYLVTNTDDLITRKRRAAEGVSKLFRIDADVAPRSADDASRFFIRSKRHAPTCNLEKVTVNLTSVNNSVIILPTTFRTGVCGLPRPVPLSTDAMIQQLAQAIAMAIKRVGPSNNARCCMPSKFRKLTVLYFNNEQHTVLRHVGNVKVTKCACSNGS